MANIGVLPGFFDQRVAEDGTDVKAQDSAVAHRRPVLHGGGWRPLVQEQSPLADQGLLVVTNMLSANDIGADHGYGRLLSKRQPPCLIGDSLLHAEPQIWIVGESARGQPGIGWVTGDALQLLRSC